ncbi:MAG: helix-hairpin-helix domain-containing protein, partial [Candidatus Omnitrophica bacterium]|nr:helix-hairpin-helix domain-containing protein [Candidatus Omnitrophota bacterium]
IKEERKININEASAWQISEVKGIGPVLAQRIVDYRSKYGSFFRKEDLLDVKGVGEKKLKKIAEYILFE